MATTLVDQCIPFSFQHVLDKFEFECTPTEAVMTAICRDFIEEAKRLGVTSVTIDLTSDDDESNESHTFNIADLAALPRKGQR